jgi:hypothetical protein
MNKFVLHSSATLGFQALTGSGLTQDHGHLNVGAVGRNQNDKLIFDNGAVFSTEFGYIKMLTYANAGRYAGHYQGNITLTALPATAALAVLPRMHPRSARRFSSDCFSGRACRWRFQFLGFHGNDTGDNGAEWDKQHKPLQIK